MQNAKVSGAVSITGVSVFVAIVIYLQVAQTGYDSAQQLMSELALGTNGEVMLFAFLALAVALLSLAVGLSFRGSQLVLTFVLAFASLCFAGAGMFPLGAATEIHVALVALAFIASGLAMYLLPTCVAMFKTRLCRLASWGGLAALSLSVTLGQSVVSIGIGQRLAAIALLAWLMFFSWRLLRS
jgi:hypothetical protein